MIGEQLQPETWSILETARAVKVDMALLVVGEISSETFNGSTRQQLCLLIWASAILFIAACRHGGEPRRAEHDWIPSEEQPAMAHQTPAGKEQSAGARSAFTEITVYHVIFHERSGIRLRAEWLEGRLFPAKPGVTPSLDDPNSFKVVIDAGITQIGLQDLARALTVTELKNSKLSNIQITARGAREIEIKALLHRIVPVPVQLIGEIEPTSSPRINIRIKSMKVLHIPFKGLLHAMGLSPSQAADVKNSQTIQFQKDHVYLRTDDLFPPPRRLGRITDVHLTKSGELEEHYGDDALQKAPPRGRKTQNYMQLTGGSIRFGKLTMNNADLTLIDSSPGDWFEFDLANYRRQLTAGDMHMTTNGGLLVFTPDVTKIETSHRHSSTTSGT
jgi:hypothetical protein